MKRWTPRIIGLMLIVMLFMASPLTPSAGAFSFFDKDGQGPRVIVVFVDMSGSTNQARRTVYSEAFDKIYQNLQQGDRLVVGTITSRSFIDFKPVVDAEVPKQSIWVNRISFEQNFAKTKKTIQQEVGSLLSRKRGTPYTEILNSLNIADTIFHEETRQKILVILSDMVQDSKEYNFERSDITEKYINDLIRYRHQQKLIPDLSGVKVYVAGASADDSRKFRSIERFWSIYFAKTGADYSTHRYGHSLLAFEKER
jgi:hypothetical protein